MHLVDLPPDLITQYILEWCDSPWILMDVPSQSSFLSSRYCLGGTATYYRTLLRPEHWHNRKTHPGPNGRTLLSVGGWGVSDTKPHHQSLQRLRFVGGRPRKSILHDRSTLLAALVGVVTWGSVVVELPCRWGCHDRVRQHEPYL